MTQSDDILTSIHDLQEFAEAHQYQGLIAGLSVALEAYIKDASSDDDARLAALRALNNVG